MKFETLPKQEAENGFEKKVEKAVKLIREKLSLDPGVRGELGDDYFSGDAASLFTLLNDPEQVHKLIKIGWGEFSKETFSGPLRKSFGARPESEERYRKQQQALRDLPTPVYCVRQYDSYFADEKQREIMEKNPGEYLKENSVFMYNQGKFLGSKDEEWLNNYKEGNEVDLPCGDIDQLINFLEKL